MSTIRMPVARWSAAIALVFLLGPPVGASPQEGPTGGVSREEMWWAPTAEDWKRPCLVTWQRTWEDAVRLSEETGKMILVCVNMDGEIASEHYAGVRYRQPEIAALYAPYVTVIASVYRHTPRDYDEQGRRVLCPRFGSVTCGEHIAIEPIVHDLFMDGKRIAPRHIGVELDGSETYDVYYAWDTDSVFAAIKEGARHVEPRADLGERTELERVASPDVVDRTEVENEYLAGDRAVRRRLIRDAIEARDAASCDLVRLAVYDLDEELNRLARQALVRSSSEKAIGLINDALRVPMDTGEREALIAALDRLGAKYPRARTLAAVHRGLASRSDSVDVEGWSSALAGVETPAPQDDRAALEYRLESTARESETRAADPRVLLDHAEASLAMAIDPETTTALAADVRNGPRFERLMLEDALESARRAEDLGAEGWRLDAVVALAAYYAGDLEGAYPRAEEAVAGMPSGEQSWNAMAVLALFAQARQQAILAAVREDREWPAQWLTDVDAAYSVLARHPLGTDSQVAAHYDFLRRLGGVGRAARVLEQGLERFPDSWELHGRLRAHVLEEKGIAGLEDAYEEMLERKGGSAGLEWFAGYASLVAAEYHRRQADLDAARASYDRAILHYEHCIEHDPESRSNADHYVAIAQAGRARLALEREDFETALDQLLLAFERKPEAAATLDGLGLSAVATASTLRARLAKEDRADLVARLDAGLARLDPALLELPAFERLGRDAGGARR